MPELDQRDNYFKSNGYPHDPIYLWKDFYFLLAIFGASKIISQFRNRPLGDQDYSMFSICRSIEFSEASKLLLSIAIICRNEMQQTRPEVKESPKPMNHTVGWIKFKKERTEKLSFYNSCNKIIHANAINFDLSDNTTVRSGYLKPFVYLYGVQDKQEWKAKINVYPFTESVFRLF